MFKAQPTNLPVRGIRLGFLVVVFLLTGGASFTLFAAKRTNEKVDRLVTASLERERLLGLIRLDAALLAQAADDHITAANDDERLGADKAMDVILKEVQQSIDNYTKDLPRQEIDSWVRFKEISQKLVKTVAVTVKYSNRKEAERARQHLEEEVKPIYFTLDTVADSLARENAEQTRQLLADLQELRFQSSVLAAAVIGLAMVLSLLVGFQVTRVLRRQEKTILEQVAELARRNTELDSFASRVAHDLVAPLSPLKGYLTLARRGTPDEQVKELLAQAESSTSRMSELVEALLRFCRAGRPPERAVGELDTAVTTILLEQSQAAQAQGVLLERQLEPRVSVQVAATLLQSIAQNVLSNAVKYTARRPEAKVQVRVSREKGFATLEVTDNGPGMSSESLQALFTPFFRAPEARGLPGYGLGLATTKRLVEAHGGAIDVKSERGVGTQVTVRLPLADAAAAPLQPNVPEARA